MKYVYFDYGGSHSSVVAASIHVGILDPRSVPSAQALNSLRYFDKNRQDEFGLLHHVGTDEQGADVFVLGTKDGRFGPTLQGILRLIKPQERLVAVSTMPYVNLLMRVGGYLSRRWSLVWIGRPLVIAGTKMAYAKLSKLVARTRANTGGGEVQV